MIAMAARFTSNSALRSLGSPPDEISIVFWKRCVSMDFRRSLHAALRRSESVKIAARNVP
jgi:hypothetical protein